MLLGREHLAWLEFPADDEVPELRGDLPSGEYQPGQRLPSIVTLMQEYGVAHLTANKALRLLADEGLAVLSPGMGYYVSAGPASG